MSTFEEEPVVDISSAFAITLRAIRKQKGMSQEDFLNVCSQSYMSQLERGINSPTLNMIDALAEQMHIHPLTLLLKAYAAKQPDLDLEALMNTVVAECKALDDKDLPPG